MHGLEQSLGYLLAIFAIGLDLGNLKEELKGAWYAIGASSDTS